ncbi:NOG1 family protein [Natronorarus salvus]|uniref:NOG1 family protein n=1 Tax=Natronorarus salvus TaxID=3117733 RepID=UPI002F2695C5
MIFENLPTVPTSEELIDKAFSRAARAGRSKSGLDAQASMLQTASNILSDNLQNVITEWPDFETVDPFYYELADAIVDVDELRQSLSRVQWASRQTKKIGREAQGKLRGETEMARKTRKQAFARMAEVVRQVDDDLLAINEARNDLRDLPDIRPDEPTIVVAGYPNVGKSSFVNSVTRARNEIAEYPFTTRGIYVGHTERDHVRYQIVDTPGLLDRPPEERNEIESQAVSAITHLADAVLVFLDASLDCGYPLDVQLELQEVIEREFDEIPVITVCNKADRSTDVEADHYVSVAEDEGVEELLDAAIEAIGYEPTLPFED